MIFAHDTEAALLVVAALVNTDRNGVDRLADLAALEDYLAEHPYTGTRARDENEAAQVRGIRELLRAVWAVDGDQAAAARIVNDLLNRVRARPQLVRHGDEGWHIHATPPDVSLSERMLAEAAMALVDLIRTDELSRLRYCAGTDCDAVLIDLSKNRSRRFCDTGNCANRAHVAAYRARQESLSRETLSRRAP